MLRLSSRLSQSTPSSFSIHWCFASIEISWEAKSELWICSMPSWKQIKCWPNRMYNKWPVEDCTQVFEILFCWTRSCRRFRWWDGKECKTEAKTRFVQIWCQFDFIRLYSQLEIVYFDNITRTIQKDLAAIGSQTRENSRIRRGGGLCPKIAILNAKRLIFSPKIVGRKFEDILNPEQLRFLVLVMLFSWQPAILKKNIETKTSSKFPKCTENRLKTTYSGNFEVGLLFLVGKFVLVI